jgi:hypothetical protein
MDKVEQVAAQFALLHECVHALQANLIFGLDSDEGDEPLSLTKEFMARTPFVWPVVNIPVPFGNTPLYDEYVAAGRILETLPFTFYYAPYLATTLKNYDPLEYYDKLIELLSFGSTAKMLRRRIRSASHPVVKLVHWARTIATRATLRGYRQILDMLRSDRGFLAFHEKRSKDLPEFYHYQYERMLGRYATLVSRADRIPVLERSTKVTPGLPAPGCPSGISPETARTAV